MRVKLVRSLIGVRKDQRDTVHALGLRKTGDVKELPANDSVRGMIDKVSYLLEIEGQERK